MNAFAKLSISTLVLAASCCAFSQDTRFAQTYTWLTEAKGQHELELKMSRLDRDTWLSENELEFGLTDHLTLAPYLNFLGVKDEPTLGGWALETRYRFGELRSRTLLPALYFEPQQLAGDPALTFEGRLIGSYYTSDKFDTLISGNLVMERLMERNEQVGFGYAIGAVKMCKRGWLGAEAYGSWTDKEHFIGPTGGIKVGKSASLIVNYAFPLNGQDSQLKVILAHDF